MPGKDGGIAFGRGGLGGTGIFEQSVEDTGTVEGRTGWTGPDPDSDLGSCGPVLCFTV